VAGITDDAHGGFVFVGFLSSKSLEREVAVQALANEPRASVLLEAPHRIEALAQALAILGERRITIGRELTKQFEEIATVSAAQFPTWLGQDSNRLRGEFALVVHPAPTPASDGPDTRVLLLLLEHLPLKTAVKLAADITGEPRNALYQAALDLRQEK
jgi:16S rRNA (cytidine1402-2'-O)-methyltransferase